MNRTLPRPAPVRPNPLNQPGVRGGFRERSSFRERSGLRARGWHCGRGWLCVVALIPLFALGCGGGDAVPPGADGRAGSTAEGDGPLRVVSTTGMITDLAARVGGDGIELVGLMGPGVDPHLFRASAGDVRTLAAADLILYNGLDLEARLGEVLSRMDRGPQTLAVTSAIPQTSLLVLDPEEGGVDPHVWMDVELWRLIVPVLAEAFSALDPDGREGYEARAAAVDAELEALHQWVLDTVAVLPPHRRVLVTAHDAFGYFGRAYGFEVRGLQGISTVTEAGAGDVQDLVRFLVERGTPAIFVESSVSPRTLEAVRQGVMARGGQVRIGGTLYSDALGSPGTEAGTYAGMIRENVRALIEGLSEEGA